MRECWTGEDNTGMPHYKNVSTATYIAQLSDKIEAALKIAKQNMTKAHVKTKQAYDKHSSKRALEPGDLALLLRPTSENKIFSTWLGPYEVTRRCENNNYELQMENRKAIYHINCLRKYNRGDETQNTDLTFMVIDDFDEDEIRDSWSEQTEPDVMNAQTTETDGANSQFTIGKKLTAQQKVKVQDMIRAFPDVFTDKPGKTELIEHKIELTDHNVPYQASYRIP